MSGEMEAGSCGVEEPCCEGDNNHPSLDPSLTFLFVPFISEDRC